MLKDILAFFKNISFIDYVFFFTVIFLLVLIVSLIYFIRINEDVIETEEKLEDPENLQAIARDIKPPSKPITFTSYEKEQEEKAIISYDELLSSSSGKDYELNYTDEKDVGDISVKKVDLNNIVSSNIKPKEARPEVHVISLAREEEFLKALKELQKRLN